MVNVGVGIGVVDVLGLPDGTDVGVVLGVELEGGALVGAELEADASEDATGLEAVGDDDWASGWRPLWHAPTSPSSETVTTARTGRRREPRGGFGELFGGLFDMVQP